MRIAARFNGTCRLCQTKVRKGEEVDFESGTGITSCPVCREFPESGVEVELCAQITQIKHQSERSNWGVVKARVTDVIRSDCTDEQAHLTAPGRLYSVAGPVGIPVEGEESIVRGRLILDPKWGMQIKLSAPLESRGITSLPALRAYLDMAPNIGPARTEEIIRLGKHDLSRVYALLGPDWEQLVKVKGITRESAEEIHAWYERTLANRGAIQFLSAMELPQNVQRAALAEWRANTETVIRRDPFVLMRLSGCGFKTADAVATHVGIGHSDPRRVAAAVLHILQRAAEDGHTYLARDIISGQARAPRFSATESAVNDVGLSGGELSGALVHALELAPVKIVEHDGDVALESLRVAEARIADALMAIDSNDVPNLQLPENISTLFGGLTPAPEQANACRVIAERGVVVLTGGPGTGKTQTTRAVIQLLHDNGLTVFSVAPTGRAALRLAELTGHPAATIHRQIAIKPGVAPDEFTLGCDAIVCDESSMIDVELAAQLLAVIDTERPVRLVFVGDVDQLPPVGAGAFFKDLIDSERVPVVRLTQIFRQAGDSPIPHIARAFNEGAMPSLERSDGFAFINTAREDAEEAAQLAQDTVVMAATKWLIEKERGGAKSIADIAVVAPQRTGLCGVRALNERISAIVNAGKSPAQTLPYGDGAYFEGDKVMHTVNNYELNVFNGEIGTIACVSESGEAADRFTAATGYEVTCEDAKTAVVVEYAAPGMPGNKRFVGYSRGGMHQLTLAYAITTHKMQGSSAPCVIFAATAQHRWMLSRRLIYTTVTRAERYLLIVGDAAVIRRAVVAQSNDAPRNTRLRGLLTPPARTAKDWFDSLDVV